MKPTGLHLARTLLVLAILGATGMWNCSEKHTSQPASNETPATYLWLFPVPDTSLGTGVSRQHLHWWGEDPDGTVRGFLFSYAVFPNTVRALPVPDTLRYTYLTSNDTIIAFPLDTLFRKYTVFVRAVDNNFTAMTGSGSMITSGDAVMMGSSPFWDKNRNGLFDGNDERLQDLNGAVDPVGAVLTFPIRNTPPTIILGQNPADPTVVLRQPETTYTVATFAWKGADADGDNTLASYRIALNDTSDPSAWLTLATRDTIVTLVVPRARSDAATATVTADVYGGRFLGRRLIGTLDGLRLDAQNRLFVQAKDVAGEFSQPLTMPSGQDTWYVRKPRARLLLVSDYIAPDQALAVSTYLNALAAVPGGEFAVVDRIDIGRGLSPDDKKAGRFGVLVPAFVDPALIYTFLLYDYVVWYTEQFPSLRVAQLSLFTFIQNGGKVIFSTTFENTVDPRGALKDFAPIDSISSVDLSTTRPPVPPPVAGDTRIPANFIVYADSSDPTSIYPQLAFNSTPTNHIIFMRPVYRRSDAKYIYRLQPDTRDRYLGSPNVAVVDGAGSIVFVGLPLHLLDNTTFGNADGLTAFFTKVVTQGFSPSRSVNRREF